jgi:alpha-galactosidase
VHPGEAPLWRYWGPRLTEDALPGMALREDQPPPTTWALQRDERLSIFPGLGLGWFGQPALLAHRGAEAWTLAITDCTVEHPDAARLRFHLTDSVARLAVTIDAHLDPASDALALNTRLTNQGDAILDVQWLAAGGIPLPADAASVRSYGGRYNDEFVPIDDPLTRSIWRRENRRGIASHDCFPGAVVHCADGTAYGAQLSWSGNHAQQIEWLDDGRHHWQMGEWLAPGEVLLNPGETLQSPEMLATCSTAGADGVAHNFHRAIRTRTPWPGGAMKPRPVHLNTWEACYFNHDEAGLKALATAAANVGVERFVLDDGWFHGRHSDHNSLGDWWPDTGKYPCGLKPLADHVVAQGIEFGLWIEPEMVSPDSDLYRAHPDWALQTAGRPFVTGRHQLVLDLSRPEVADHVFASITAVLDDLPISYLKWDHNRDLTHAGTSPRYRQQVHAAYALIDRFRSRYPHIEIEACAGGGGRIDAGIAAHVHRFWPSDNLDPLARLAIQSGFLQFLPPEVMGSHVGASPAHSSGRQSPMRLRCGVAMMGAFGVELHLGTLDDPDRAELVQGIALYKQHRHLLHGNRIWHGEQAGLLFWQAHGSADELLLFIVGIAPSMQNSVGRVCLSMLDSSATYAVRDIHSEDSAPMITTGKSLAKEGVGLAPALPGQCQIFHIAAQ